ncbi:MAG TPA: hypothetical protein VGL56_19370 [Fimbriimonadaceae bacterium]
MSYDIPQIHIPDNSPEAKAIDFIVTHDHVTPEEAVRTILRRATKDLNPAQEGRGLFGSPEDAAALDAAVKLAYEERHTPSKRETGE